VNLMNARKPKKENEEQKNFFLREILEEKES
jgi:hypothetical protein